MARFRIRARAEPQTVLRVLGHIAQIGLVPALVRAREAEGSMTILIEQDHLSRQQADLIAAKMRASVLVEEVILSHHNKSTRPAMEVCR